MRFGLLFITLLGATLGQNPKVTRLRWVSPDSSKPTRYRQWRTTFSSSPQWRVKPLQIISTGVENKVAILVEEALVPAISANLDTLIGDLTAEGYQVQAFAVSGTSCESLRFFLKEQHQQGLVSALLIGNLPVPWFQLFDDWDNDGERDPDEGYEEFPCDLYLMDLNGAWEDNLMYSDSLDSLIPGNDSIFDIHYGDLEPEIGISRLYVSTLGNGALLLNEYLTRCHGYRQGQLRVSDRALVYIDDDWAPWAPDWDSCVGLLYPSRVFISDPEETRVLDYQPRIDTAAYQWIQLCAHSWPGGHAMKFDSARQWDWFFADTIPYLNPEANFYNLFACSNVRFIEAGYCGGMYVFSTSTGLAAIGSTKTGSMLEFQDFYGPLGGGATLAEAFLYWFAQRIGDEFEPWEKAWFYGMCLIGDGFLKPRIYTPVAEQQTPPNPGGSTPNATIVRGILFPPASSGERLASTILLDVTGRKVMEVKPGPNDVKKLPAGVYFITSKGFQTTLPVVIIH